MEAVFILDAPARQQRARLAGFARAAMYDSLAVTAAGRQAADQRFYAQVLARAAERGETLAERELERRTAALRKAHFARMTLASIRARAEKKNRRPGQHSQAAAAEEGEELERASAPATS